LFYYILHFTIEYLWPYDADCLEGLTKRLQPLIIQFKLTFTASAA